MASVSQNFPRTYYNLAKTWDAKVGNMSFEQASFIDNKTNKERIARLLHAEFKTQANGPSGIVIELARIGDLMSDHYNMDNVSMYDNSIWIYNMRTSDTLPKSPNDLKRLYQFVKIAISQWFASSNEIFLADDRNIHITVSFFVWYITKPHFFFKDKVTRQTTRFGIERIWTPLLLAKKVSNAQPQTTKVIKSKQPVQITNALLPKQQKAQENLRLHMEKLTDCTFEWENSHSLHLNISKYLSGNELNINQQKKLQKTYNEYIALTEKVNKTLTKIRKTDMANAKIVKVKPEESVEEENWEEGQFVGEKRVLVDKSAEEEVPDNWEDEEVPDNWEDEC